MTMDFVAGHDDYRVPSGVKPIDRRLPIGAPNGRLVGIAIHIQTTELGHEQRKISEVATRCFTLDEHERIVETG